MRENGMEEEEQELMGYCGYNCHLCAARSDDPAVRQRLVDGWRKLYGHTMYTAENVKCVGCPNEGEHADTSCKARPCAIGKGVKSCAYCDDFPCDNLRPLISPMYFATEEEYDLCMRQFEVKENLKRMLKGAGKEPFWARKR
jgi:hypothetical protein